MIFRNRVYHDKICKIVLDLQRQNRKMFSSERELKSQWISTVGLEVHAQINSVSKLFSGSSTGFGNPTNSNVSYFDAAIPGTLPVLNKKCVENAIMTALALNSKINPVSAFDRKHYFYADLPAGYQITQQRKPLATEGSITFHVFTPGVHKKPYSKKCRIKQIQLEQDSGKSLHDDKMQRSLIDLNRAGVGLMEIVFEPDLSDGEEAAALIKELSLILTALNVCSCKMEEGALRVDVNVSIRGSGESQLGVRSEVKNISSIRGVAKAVEYEVERQTVLREGNISVVNETRAWDPDTSSTLPMRDKEVKQDYRFMPEPNLPPLRINTGKTSVRGLINIEEIRQRMPALPFEIREKLMDSFGISLEFAVRLVNEPVLLQTFFNIMSTKPSLKTKTVVNILINEILTFVNKGTIEFHESSINAKALGDLCELLDEGTINSNTSKKVLEEILKGHNDPKKLVLDKDWHQIIDENALTDLCKQTIDGNKKLVDQYKAGKKKVFPAFLGIIAKNSNNKANLEIVTKILKKLLD